MKHLTQWAKGKPLGLVIIAQQFAIGAETCFEFLKLIKSGDRVEVFSSLRKDKEWVRLYRNHRQMVRSLIEGLRKFGETGELVGDIAELMFLKHKTLRKALTSLKRRFEKMRPFEWRRFVGEGQKELNKIYNLQLDDIESDINGKVDEKFNKKLKEALNNPGINFYLRVWIPCWLLYGEYPPRLLRRARLRELSAMEKLVRLDTRVLNDVKIGEYFHEAKEEGRRWTVERLTDALRKGPKGKITVKKVKCSIAGAISSISILLGHKLTEPEIRKLFDAVAHDMRKGDIDTDLPESPEAFAKAIQRERGFWMPTLRPDKK